MRYLSSSHLIPATKYLSSLATIIKQGMCVGADNAAGPEGAAAGAAGGERGQRALPGAGPRRLRARAGHPRGAAEPADAGADGAAAGGAGGDADAPRERALRRESAGAPLLGGLPAGAGGAVRTEGHRVRAGRPGAGAAQRARQHADPAGAPGATGSAPRALPALHRREAPDRTERRLLRGEILGPLALSSHERLLGSSSVECC